MSTYPSKELFEKVDKRAAELYDELTELTDLLKKLHRMSWGNDTWLYWDDVDSWVVRIQPYRSRTQRVLYEGPSVLEALRVLVEGKG